MPSAVDATHTEQRIVEAAAVLPDGAAITGWAALHWAGGRYFSGLTHGGRTQLPVTLAVNDRRRLRVQDGLEICEEYLGPGDVVEVDGLPFTRPERSVCRMVRAARRLEDRVRILDMAAFDDLCSPGEVEAYARERLTGHPNVTRIWQAVPFAEENSWSPMEPIMRMRWLQTRRVPLLVNMPIFDERGRHLITPDLFDPVARVAGEYDGAPHEGVDPRERDLDREELYRRLGIELVTMMSGDLVGQERFVARLVSAYRRAASGFRTGDRWWTLDQPDWWVDVSTVAARRALSDKQREVWLRRQVA